MPKDNRYPNLSGKQIKAAWLLAEDSMPDTRIAEECGIAPTTLYQWKKIPEFDQAKRDRIRQLDDAVSQLQFVKRRNRLDVLNDQLKDYLQIREERAKWYLDNDPEIPGGKTGRLTRTIKVIGVGKAAQRIEEHALDKALESQIQATLKHIAQERGEWTEKREVTGADGAPLIPIVEIEVLKQASPPSGSDDD